MRTPVILLASALALAVAAGIYGWVDGDQRADRAESDLAEAFGSIQHLNDRLRLVDSDMSQLQDIAEQLLTQGADATNATAGAMQTVSNRALEAKAVSEA